MKRLTIIKRNYLERGKAGWYNETSEYEVITDKTDKQVEKYLEEINQRKREHKWVIAYKYDFSKKKDKEAFIQAIPKILDNFKKLYSMRDKIKTIAKEIIEEM